MKTLCVIGNSHIAAIRLGWLAISHEYPDTEVIFFGAPGNKAENMEIVGGRLAAKNEEAVKWFKKFSGRSSISGQYDAYAICDLGIKIKLALDFCSIYRSEGQAVDDRIPISESCLHAALLGSLRNTFAVATITKLRQITDAPIALIPAPMRSIEHPDPTRKKFEQNGEDILIAGAFGTALCLLAKELNLRLFHTPGAVLSSPFRTKSIYTRARSFIESDMSATIGSIGMDLIMDDRPRTDFVDEDYGHMNGRYGAIILRPVLKNLGFATCLPISELIAAAPEKQTSKQRWWYRKVAALLRRMK